MSQVAEIAGAIGRINDKGEREYERRFRVVTDNPLIGAQAVREATGIPRRGDPYVTATDTDLAAVVTGVEATQDGDNPRVWEIRASYGASGSEQEREENPLNRPAEIGWGFNKFSRVAERDADGKPICNSAGDRYDPPPEMDDSRPVLTIARNEGGFNAQLAIDYQDAVNEDSFFGFPAETVKVTGIQSQRQIENKYIYWRTTYEFEIRRDGWQPQILDAGRRCKILGNFVAINKRSESGAIAYGLPVDDPVPLDGHGNELTSPTPEKAIFTKVKLYTKKSFSALHLP